MIPFIFQTKEGAKGQKVQNMKQTCLGLKKLLLKIAIFLSIFFLSKIVPILGSIDMTVSRTKNCRAGVIF